MELLSLSAPLFPHLHSVNRQTSFLEKVVKRFAFFLLQGGPGHLYLLKNKVATFAKVEKEEDMI